MRIIIFIAMLLKLSLCETFEVCSAFDIGTGKIKMQIAKIDGQKMEPLHYQSEQLYFSNQPILNSEGLITEEGERRIIAILESFKLLAKSHGSTKCEAIATELFRKALNGEEIAKNISNQLGIEVKILSPKEEGILSFLTVVQEGGLDPEDVVVLDIGAGSFQITSRCEDEFIVYGAPFGKLMVHELVKDNKISDLEAAMGNVDPRILKRIADCKGSVIGIGAHPKLNTIYDKKDLEQALESGDGVDLSYSGLVLVKTIMESLSITQVKYVGGRAGNTTGVFFYKSS
jgi:hypothetical protein